MQTIIECLKQACTGELPPNTRNGQSFIHDPKACLHCCFCQISSGTLQHEASMSCVLQVAGETEVKAQIKLRFRTATSQPVVVIRTFQVRSKSALYTPRETMLITCCMDAAYTEEDCSSVQDAGPNPADLQQGHRTEAGLVLQMCRHRPHCPFAHGCFKGTACFKMQLQLH